MDNEHLFFECDNVKTLYDYCGLFPGDQFLRIVDFLLLRGEVISWMHKFILRKKKLYLFCRGCKLLVRVNSWIRASQEFRKNSGKIELPRVLMIPQYAIRYCVETYDYGFLI